LASRNAQLSVPHFFLGIFIACDLMPAIEAGSRAGRRLS
jgi:hypothetical protein